MPAGFHFAPPSAGAEGERLELPPHLLIPLASALVYPVAALMVKRANALGVGVWRTAFVANWCITLLAQPAWCWSRGEIPWNLWWQPVLPGVLFLGGQIFTFLAITRGDVSVATPVLGVKILLVAIFSAWLIAKPLPWQWWVAAVVGTAAIGFLGAGRSVDRSRIGRSVLHATLSAACYALADVFLQKWARPWGAAAFLPLMFIVAALGSFALVPFFSAPLHKIDRAAGRWVVAGAVALSVQSLGIALAVGVFGDATSVNIVYSSRGLFSVVAVWLIGHWFHATEQHEAAGVLGFRLTGAALMVSAVLLVLW